MTQNPSLEFERPQNLTKQVGHLIESDKRAGQALGRERIQMGARIVSNQKRHKVIHIMGRANALMGYYSIVERGLNDGSSVGSWVRN